MRRWWWLALSLAGAALLSVPATRFRIDEARCSSWPPLVERLVASGAYLLALGLLCAGFFAVLAALPSSEAGQARRGPGLRALYLSALVVHAVAWLSPPFLSDDPLFYAASGRAMAQFAAAPMTPLCQALPSGDRFLVVLKESWRCGQSPYLTGFHLLERLLGRVAGDDLGLALRLYQLVAAVAVLLSAALVGEAARACGRSRERAVALVALNPLAIVEATVNPHNDVFLLLSAALAVWCFAQRQRRLAALAFGLGGLVKGSAVIPLGLYVGALALRRLSGLARRALFVGGAAALLVAVVVLGLYSAQRHGSLPVALSGLFGSPLDPYDRCTRSLECLPRVILRFGLGSSLGAWWVGVVARGLGGLFLLHAALRAARVSLCAPERLLGELAAGLFLYYLFLHGWAQTWYLLPLLALLSWAGPRLLPAMLAYCVSGCAYYALVLVGACVSSKAAIAGFDVAEALLTLFPPTVYLYRARRSGAEVSDDRDRYRSR